MSAGYLDTALECASRGWPVFPCKADKTPLTVNGFKDATTGEGQIRSWWAEWPHALVGIDTGRAGLVVVDVDVKGSKPGRRNWKALVEELGSELSDTAVTRTQSGGWHIYFTANGHDLRNTTGALAEAIDTRAQGGYVIAYPWLPDHGPERLRTLPTTLYERLTEAHKEKAASPVGETIAAGHRNATLASLAGTMRRRGMNETAIAAALLVENASRCRPPLAESEVRAIASSVAGYSPTNPPEAPPAADKEAAASEAREIWLSPMTDIEWAAFIPERPEYVFEPWAVRGCITDIVGREKGGKSTFVAGACAALAKGEPFLGYETDQTGVLYLYEAGHVAWRHLMDSVGLGHCGHMYAHLWPMLPPAMRSLTWFETCEWIGDLVRKLDCRLVVLDILPTWARLAADAENDPGVARTTMESLRLMAVACDVAVWTVRHTRKGNDEDHVEGSRGTGAWIGAVDISMGFRRAVGTRERLEHPTRRIISSVGRAVLPPEILVDFDQSLHRFLEAGTPEMAERRDLRTWLLDNLPETVAEAIDGDWSRSRIKERAGQEGGYAINRVTTSLDAMVGEGLARQHRATSSSGRTATFYTLATREGELP